MVRCVETETKFSIASWEQGEHILLRGNAVLTVPRHFESNTLFDLPGQPLTAQGRMLRLRKVGNMGWLTYKENQEDIGPIKTREELDTEISDPQTLEEILKQIGLRETFRYEKERAIYRIGELKVCLDRVPIGCFIELEGEISQIRETAVGLGLSMDAATADSYLHLYERARQRNETLPPFMIFTNTEEKAQGL